eukprot:1152053-Pelagomonas_calceolata.AAC.2
MPALLLTAQTFEPSLLVVDCLQFQLLDEGGCQLLRLLPMREPVQNPGRNSAAAAAAAKQQHQHQQQLEQRPQGATEAQAEVPRYLQPVYTRQAPVVPPYLGYRGDLLAVLANAICNRPAVAEEVALEAGAVELVLGQ